MGKKYKIWKIAAIVMLVINVGLICFLWFSNQRKYDKRDNDKHMYSEKRVDKFLEKATKMLDLDTNQAKEMRKQLIMYKENSVQNEMNLLEIKKEFIKKIVNQNDSITKNEYLSTLMSHHSNIEHHNIIFLNEMVKICKPEQKEKLIQMLSHIIDKKGESKGYHKFKGNRDRKYNKHHNEKRREHH